MNPNGTPDVCPDFWKHLASYVRTCTGHLSETDLQSLYSKIEFAVKDVVREVERKIGLI